MYCNTHPICTAVLLGKSWWLWLPGSSLLKSTAYKLGAFVKGEAQKSNLFWRFSGCFWFSQERLFARNSTRKPLHLIKSPIFTNTPCKSTSLHNAPSVHNVDAKRMLPYFEDPYRTPRPTESPNPRATTMKFFRESPRVNLISPKANLPSPKVNVISPKVNLKHSLGNFGRI